MSIEQRKELHISCNTYSLKHALGYWSKTRIEYNLSPNLVVLRQKCTQDLLFQEIKELQQNLVASPWFRDYYSSWIGKNYLGSFKLNPVLSIHCNSWQTLQEELRQQKYNKQKISKYCADKWWEYYKNNPSEGVNNERLALIPPLLSPFVIDWSEIISGNTEKFILDFCKLSQIQKRPDPHILPNYSSLLQSQKITLFITQLTVEERSLIEKVLPSLSHTIDERRYYYGAHTAIDAAAVLVAWLRKKKLLVLPLNLEKIDSYFSDLEVWPKRLLNSDEARPAIKKGLLQLIISSTTEHLDDIPENIIEVYGIECFQPVFYQSLAKLLKHPKIQKKRPLFPIDKLQPGKIKRSQSLSSWTPEWVKKNYNDAWYDFSYLWWKHEVSDQSKKNALRMFLPWAYDNRRIESPWEIQAVDLRNPHRPSYNGTYAHYLENIDVQDKSACWSNSATLFRVASKLGQMVDSPTMVHGELKNPFKSVKNPFLRRRKKKDKTHRSCIPSSIHEMMIKILLSPDSKGKPTFSWAKKVLTALHLDIARVPDPDRPNKELEIWCPSRATCLAVLLLTPLRTVQARWLDQGLMDDERYDFESKSMVPNDHELRKFRYPNGKSHIKQYGRPSGVLTFSSDLLTREQALSIFVNTNKTQLWDGLRKSGYEIPWPDGSGLLQSDEPEQRAKGEWLARLYWLMEYQLKWMSKYDPNPYPISFFDSPEDSDRTTDLDEVRDSLPWFVPLFRDITDRKFVSYKLKDIFVGGHCPVSYSKISYLYRLLTFETERQWKKTFNEKIYLTYSDGNGSLCKFDLHSLRVTWVSRLFEMGVPVQIISEYIVGHATKLMTILYLKIKSAHAREAMILAAQNSDSLGIEALLKRELSSEEIPNYLVGNGPKDISNYLPDDFVAFVPVAGGICPMGGKGSMCSQGAITPPNDDMSTNKEHTEKPVQGGCGNCRYFLTGPDFIMEQLLMCNAIMYQMRSLGKEQRRLYDELDGVKWKLHELPENNTLVKYRLERQKQVYSERINEYNELLSPLLLEWCNRFEMLRISDDLLHQRGSDNHKQLLLVGNLDLCIEDYRLALDGTNATEFELVRTIIEQSRIVQRQGYTMPEEPSRFLREFMSILLDDSLWQSFLHHIPDDSYITKAASILAGVLADEFGDDEIQKYLDKKLRLHMTTFQSKKIQSFMEELCKNYIEGNKSVPVLPDITKTLEIPQ